MLNYKTLADNVGENPKDLEYGHYFLDTTPKLWSMKEIIDKLYLVKMKASVLWKTMSTEWEDKPQIGKKVFEKDMFGKWLLLNIHKILNLIIKKWITQLKNGPKTWIDPLPKKIYIWQVGIWKDAHHLSSLGNCK